MIDKKTETNKKLQKRPFPRFSLEDVLILASTIQDKNAGKQMNRLLLADAIDRKPTSTEFRDLLSSSYKYGLTEGTEKAEYITLTELGKKITRPINEIELTKAKQQACLTPPLFNKIFSHYKNAKFPGAGTFFENTLEREFTVPREYLNEIIKILEKNGNYAGILRSISGSTMVMFNNYDTPVNDELSTEENEKTDLTTEDIVNDEPQIEEKKQDYTEKPRPIFIAHGKNTKPLDQLLKILQEFKLNYHVAIEEPHSGRPISQKVRDLMKECGSAIFIFSKTGESTSESGETMPNLNVVFELGAASVLYGEKVVIFKEDGLKFPSDFNDLGYISFESDKLDAQAIYLLKELVSMGFLKITSA